MVGDEREGLRFCEPTLCGCSQSGIEDGTGRPQSQSEAELERLNGKPAKAGVAATFFDNRIIAEIGRPDDRWIQSLSGRS